MDGASLSASRFDTGLSADYKCVSRYSQLTNERLAGLNTLKFSVWLSRGAGLSLAVNGTLILIPVCRTLVRWIRPKVKWLPLDENLWFHRQVAYAMLLFTIIHVSAHYIK